MFIIKSIKIKNFRKIKNIKIDLSNLSIFIGNNDVGKSTILKGLNLFFNNKTEIDQIFDFNLDFCKDVLHTKATKEIVIELEIIPSPSYNIKEPIIWQKVWTKTEGKGPLREKIFLKKSKSQLPTNSKINTWIKNIEYKYIPAIKSEKYFSILLGDLHNTLTGSTINKLNKTSEEFSKTIKDLTTNISTDIKHYLKIDSYLDLPSSLKDIFENLKFKTGAENILLNQRGDGIKAKHIPIILKFISSQRNKLKGKKSPRVTTIWGYEEPENNLEMANAFDSAEMLYTFSKDVQILITTHSPAFYLLDEFSKFKKTNITNLNKIKTYLIEDDIEHGVKLILKSDIKYIDNKMGWLPFLSAKYPELINQINCLNEDCKNKVYKNVNIFVEGITDKLILSKALEVFSSDKFKKNIKNIQIIDCGGCEEVCTKIKGAALLKLISIGIFDVDAKTQISNLKTVVKEEISKNNVKIINYPKTDNISKLYELKIYLNYELEDLYPDELWVPSNLESKIKFDTTIIPKNKSAINFIKSKLSNESNNRLCDMCFYSFKDNRKHKLAKRLCKKNNIYWENNLGSMKIIVDQIEEFYNKNYNKETL